VEMLFPLHLDYAMEFSGSEQNTDWLMQKAASHKSKFETGQQNRETEKAKEELQKRRRVKKPQSIGRWSPILLLNFLLL
jgi:hypothetical protein